MQVGDCFTATKTAFCSKSSDLIKNAASVLEGKLIPVVPDKGNLIFFGKTSDLLHRSRPVIVAKTSSPQDLAKLKLLVEAQGHPATLAGEELRVDAGDDWGAALNQLAFENGILLTQLTPVRPSLEETFFEMTEN